jgi:hypothetical protein
MACSSGAGAVVFRIADRRCGRFSLIARGVSVNERLETLKRARERMIEQRDEHAKVLAAPFDRDKAERARNKFLETQTVIEALERAMNAEERALR